MNKADTFEKQLSVGDRRYAINVQAFNEHKTIEVRMHQGTLNPDELIPWIKLLLKVTNYHTPVQSSVNTLKQAKKQFDIDEQLEHSLQERILSMFVRPKKAAPDVPTAAQAPGATLRAWLGM
jgi:uncharacterized protein YbcC (UPF0753/DUF2309 family)